MGLKKADNLEKNQLSDSELEKRKLDIEEEKLEIERKKLNLEKEKLKIEQGRTKWTTVSIIITALAILITFSFNIWVEQKRDIESAKTKLLEILQKAKDNNEKIEILTTWTTLFPEDKAGCELLINLKKQTNESITCPK